MCMWLLHLAIAASLESSSSKWPDSAWHVTVKGDVEIRLKEDSQQSGLADLSREGVNEWYQATNSKKYGVSSWANLNYHGRTYLVGSMDKKTGKELPTKNDVLVVFTMREHEKGSDGKVDVTLRALRPKDHVDPKNLKNKDSAGLSVWAPVAHNLDWKWSWPKWKGEGASKDADLESMLHSLKEDVKMLSQETSKEAIEKESMEREDAKFDCGFIGIFPFGAFFCGVSFTPA